MVNQSKLRGSFDLAAIVTLTASLTVCITLTPSGTPRIILGVPFVVFCPGYALLAALFPSRHGLTTIERIALSFVLSMAIVPLVGLLLNFVWEISLYPILVSVSAFALTTCAIAYFRRKRLAPQDRFEPQIGMQRPRLGPQSRWDRTLAASLAIILVGTTAALIYLTTRPGTAEPFTEFFLLGPSGRLSDYPSGMILGAHENVTVGVTNCEGELATYRIRVSFDSTDLRAIDGLTLQDGETWQETITLTPAGVGDNQKVEFLLYRDGEQEPYHELNLWIDVRNPSGSE